MAEAQLCKHVYPLFCYLVQNCLGFKEEEDKQAVFRAVVAMIGVLLHGEQHREHAWEQLILYQYRDAQDTFLVTQDWTMEDPWESIVYRVFLGLVQLRKLKPSLSREESCSLLAECCHTILSLPPKEEMEGRGKTVRQAQNIQTLYMLCLEGLGQIIVALLEAEVTSACFEDVVHVLQCWLTSAKAWERKRALQVCAQLLGACEERSKVTRGCTCKQFGFLVGLLGPLTSDSLATSRQLAGVCLRHLLQIQARTRNVAPETGDFGRLCKGLDSPDDTSLLETSNEIAKTVCEYFPPAQAADFMSTVTETLKCATDRRAWAAGVWMTTFLERCGQLIYQEVPEVLHVLYSCMQTMQQSTHRPLLLQAVYLLARFHHEPVVDSLLQKRLPMDRDAMELWRTLGRSVLGIQVLECLTQKLEAAGENSPRPHSSAPKPGHSQAALESLMLPRAISEVVFVLPTEERVRRLLPRLLPGLLGEVSKALGQEMLLPPLRCRRGLFLNAPRREDKPCSPYCKALELVLSRCLEKRWLLLLWRQGAWTFLENPQAHTNGVCLLTSVLLRNQLISRGVIWALSQWLNSHSENLQLTATAFFAELMKDPPFTEKKFLKNVLGVLIEKSQHRISAVRQMAVRGLGNAVRRAPKQVQKHKEAILEVLQRGLENTTCPEVAAESMLALAEVVRKMKAEGLGSAFKDIARSTKMFFEAGRDHSSPEKCGKPGSAFSCTSGILTLKSPTTTLYLCAPFLGPERVQEGIITSIGLSAAELQYEVCHCLVTDAPAMLERLHSIARSRHLENGQALHSSAIAVLEDILEKARGLSGSCQQQE
ncbi:maestro heat-like repeat-containing protein family member 2B [Theristicus caerulescens]